MKLAIIIVNWNVKELLVGCLRSVEAELARSDLPAQVWVVDNASTDGSVDMIRRDFPGVRLIASRRNLGFAGGNNAALHAIGFDNPSLPDEQLPEAVLLLNPDTVVHPAALTAIVNFLDEQPRAGIVGARLVYGDGSFQHSAFGFPGLWQLAIELLPLPARLTETRLNGRYPRTWYERGRPFRIGHPLGAAIAVRREAIRQAGLMDEQYHMYVEEVDWSLRITRAGWQAYCVPAAVVTHLGGQSTGQIKTSSFINLWTSRYRFYQKHYPRLAVWLARQIVRAGMHRLARRDKAAARAGQLAAAEFKERLQGYQAVLQVWEVQ